MNLALQCPACRVELPAAELPAGAPQPCLACGRPLQAELFPAAERPLPRGLPGEPIAAADEAACFYHAEKKAVVPCAICGRFLCRLCDIDLGGTHYCMNCLEAGRRNPAFPHWTTSRVVYDELALLLAIAGWIGLLFASPVALFLAIRFRKEPISLVEHRRWRIPAAIVLSSLHILAMLAVIVLVIVKT